MVRAADFWSHVAVGEADDCWEWQLSRRPNGYGQFRWPRSNENRHRFVTLTHRIAYRLAHGPIDDDLIVRHSCDNPPCCNPAHLSIGTHADNAQDAIERGRRPARRRKELMA